MAEDQARLRERSNPVVVVGSAAVDVTVRVARMPRLGETVRGTSSSLVVGGKGANQAIMSARLGGRTLMVGRVGDDAFADLVTLTLESASVDISHLVRVTSRATGIAQIRVDERGDNDIATVAGANETLSPADIDNFFKDTGITSGVLLAQLETPIDTVLRAIRVAHQMGLVVILDPAPAKNLPEDIWQCVDVVTPNEIEAEQITGIRVADIPSAAQAGRWFIERGVVRAIVTRGADGALLVDALHSERFPPHAGLVVIDSTAAGDAFAGALAASIAKGLDLTVGLQYAMAAGALAVTKAGASSSLPTRAEVDELVSQAECQSVLVTGDGHA